MAVVQLRNQTPGRDYYDARKDGGMPSLMAMRALKRRLSNVVYARMLADQKRRSCGPGRATGDDYLLQRDRPDPGHPLFGSHVPDPPPSLEHCSRRPLT